MRYLLVIPALALAALAMAGGPGSYATGTTVACTTTNQACASGSCSGAVPDAGNATGISLASVQSYFVRVCPPTGQTLQGAGTAKDFHCSATTGKCAEVVANAQSITAPAATCWESPTFVVPYTDITSDTMTWVLSGVTVSPDDAGTATISICPQK
ncbi:MAG TPA: hypothetical protein VFP50_15450 [Anaeromyxobacteraceae bacterium]|nr:hypothetical protein [Anaeromyxobacteraceae bacterium]